MRSLILHSLKMHKVQTASIVVSVALSVAVCLVLVLMYGGVTRGIEISSERGGSDIMVVPESAENYVTSTELLYTGVPAPMYMSEDAAEEIASLDGVERATVQFFSQTLNQSCCSATGETRLIGVDFNTDFIVTPLVDEGATENLADDEVIIGTKVDGVVNGAVSIYGKQYKVRATMAETGGDLDSSIVLRLDVAQEISRDTPGYESYWERMGDPSTLVSSVMIDATDDEEIYSKLLNKIKLVDGVVGYENSETAERATAQLQSVFVLLAAAAIAMIVVTLLQLFARFYSCVWDRKSELALYRAIGASQSDLRKLICGEIGVMMAGGMLIGVIAGIGLEELLVGVMLDSMAFPFVGLSVVQIAGVAVATIAVFAIIAALSVLWPLRQVGRLDPSLAMQQGDID